MVTRILQEYGCLIDVAMDVDFVMGREEGGHGFWMGENPLN